MRVWGHLVAQVDDRVWGWGDREASGPQENDPVAVATTSPPSELAGGRYVDVEMTEAHVDGKLVTAPAWPAHPAWMARFLEVLGTRIEP